MDLLFLSFFFFVCTDSLKILIDSYFNRVGGVACTCWLTGSENNFLIRLMVNVLMWEGEGEGEGEKNLCALRRLTPEHSI